MEGDKHHQLHKEYKFWYSKSKDNKKNMSKEDFESELRDLPPFNTIEEFWGFYLHMRKPSELEIGSKLFLFNSRVRPLWEDESNRNGGRFYIRVSKQQGDKLWEDLVLGYIGEELEYNDEICGLQLASRPGGVIVISVWTQSIKNHIRDELINIFKDYLKMPSTIKVEYQEHPRGYPDNQSRRYGHRGRNWEGDRGGYVKRRF